MHFPIQVIELGELIDFRFVHLLVIDTRNSAPTVLTNHVEVQRFILLRGIVWQGIKFLGSVDDNSVGQVF